MMVPVLTGLKKIEFKDKPRPRVQPSEVLVSVECCGICGSDVHGYSNGMTVQLGTVMGHECSGVVVEVGEKVRNVQPSDRVWVKPFTQCGECHWCKKGQYTRCFKTFERAMGLTPRYDGAFAEYVLIKYPDQMLLKLPLKVSFEEGALVEPLAVSLHAVRNSRFRLGDHAVVVGAGMIGLGVIQFLKLGGANKIIVLEVSLSRSRIARELGADVVLNPISEGEKLKDRILDLTGGIGADIVFECSGSRSALKNTINYVSSGGQILVVGLHVKEVPFNFWTLLRGEVEIKGSFAYMDEFKNVIDFLENKKIVTQYMINDIISLADIEEKGFRRLLSSQDIIKILVRP